MAQHTRPSKQPKPLTTKEKWSFFFNQWKWSNIKATWSTEYSRLHMRSTNNLNKLNDKLR